MTGANPRAVAVTALVHQEQNGFSNLVLDAQLRKSELSGRDRAFAGAIFYTVLEHQGTLDYILEQFLPKGLARLDPPVREILRAALAQARYMQVPVSAAVNEAVKLTRAFKKSSASGLVNAVLRRACAYDLETAVFTDEIQRLMVLGSAGRDVASFLHRHYPQEALDILTRQADGGRTSLHANPLRVCANELCVLLRESGVSEAQPGLVPGSVLARFEGSPAENELFQNGFFHVEGQASQLAALCVGARPGETVLDLCAAPGGKTLLLAGQMQDTGRLVSCDVTENRVRLIRSAVQRMGFGCVEPLVSDATHPSAALPQADRILADVPCSGLGILAKKPDLRYKTLAPARQRELVGIQSAILDSAAGLLKPGGRLVYSTCTIDPAENEQQIEAFLARHPEFAVVQPEIGFPAGMTAGEYGALSVPTRTGMDGFFLCAMQKSVQ
ncbi:MAG: 16S rRNA (cytosine(967)-C(5))-methyltransferase RsmB [Faecalibacterium sp.]